MLRWKHARDKLEGKSTEKDTENLDHEKEMVSECFTLPGKVWRFA